MKTIELGSGLVNGNEMTTEELIKICLNTIPPTGFSFQDLKDRMRIQKAMENKKVYVSAGEGDITGSFELEDADYNNFISLVAASRWNVRDRFVYDFLDKYSK